MFGESEPGGTTSISVVIPMRNACKTILRTLRSIEDQRLKPFEVIIVDNGSIDGSLDILNSYKPSIPVRVMECPKPGSGAARNVGILAAKGSHVAFLDADDVWYPDKLLCQLAAILRGHRLVGAYFDYLSEHGHVIGNSTRLTGKIPPAKALREAKAMPAPISSLVIERGLIGRCGLLDESFIRAQDFEWLTRLAQEEDLVIAGSEPLLGYVMSESSATASSYVEQALAAEHVRKIRAGKASSSYNVEVTGKLINDRIPRSILAARSYRMAGIAWGKAQKKHFIALTLHSLVLSPIVTCRKLLRQSVRSVGANRRSPVVQLFKTD